MKIEVEFEDTLKFWRVLGKRLVRNCNPTKHKPLWVCVSERSGHGSTYSRDLCRYFGFDPEITSWITVARASQGGEDEH